jgi:NAD(P)-dependent dehydrogenase (short-subunit alcohol dehydrogenase family)
MRNWLITGVSSGLGRALAEAALARGDIVTGTLRNPTAAAAFEALAPGRSRAAVLDVTDGQAVSRVAAAAGAIDVLVNNAGYSLEGVVEATNLGEIRAQIETHLVAPILLIQATLPGMRARRCGHILNIGSLAAHTPGGGTSIYAAVKAALETLSTGLAREVAPFGICVTAVIPGAFRTALGASRHSAGAEIEDYAASDATRRVRLAALSGAQRGDPAKAAAAILALTDAESPLGRFAVGPDAIEGLRTHAAALIADAALSEPLGGRTDI